MKRDPDADLKVCEAATPGPWYEFCEDDRDCSNVVGVATAPNPDPTDLDDAGKLVAVTLDNGLVAFPVAVGDDKWHENAAFIAAARDGWEPYIKVYLRLLRFIADFERDTKALPLGEEDSQKGSSAYNWRRGFIGELKAALAEVDKL